MAVEFDEGQVAVEEAPVSRPLAPEQFRRPLTDQEIQQRPSPIIIPNAQPDYGSVLAQDTSNVMQWAMEARKAQEMNARLAVARQAVTAATEFVRRKEVERMVREGKSLEQSEYDSRVKYQIPAPANIGALRPVPAPTTMKLGGQDFVRYGTRGEQVKPLAPSQPSSVRLVDEIQKSEMEANAAEKSGNAARAQQLRDRAALLREQTKGQEIVTGYDDQGRPIVRVGKGVGVPTVATQSQAQQKLLRYENSIELMNHLDTALKPEHLGAAGVTGEWILDRGLSQLVPELANKERIDARSALVAVREGLLREMSNDPRFSNVDREEISKALPSSGVFESLPSAKQRIETVRRIIMGRARIYSKGLGQPPPLWTLEVDEIKNLYKQGKIDKETALNALVRFH